MANYYHLKTWFKNKFDLPKEFKLILFKNPKEFQSYKLEYLNPNHKILIWGIQRKKYRKNKYFHYIKAGKILITTLIPIFSVGLIKTEILTLNLCYLIFSYSFNKLMFFIIDNYSKMDLNVNWNRGRIRRGKNPLNG